MKRNFSQMLKEASLKKSVTENGNVAYATTSNSLVDINFSATGLRSCTDEDLLNWVKEISDFNKKYSFIWLFMLRNVRGGIGERESFIKMMYFYIIYNDLHPAQVLRLIKQIPEYGRWDDIFYLYWLAKCTIKSRGFSQGDINDHIVTCVVNVVDEQFSKDGIDANEDKPISLLAKWAPRINSKNNNVRKLIAQEYLNDSRLFYTAAQYRRSVSSLNRYIDTVEIKMCAKKWGAIEYSKVPSKANLRYAEAFDNHDHDRRSAWLDAVEAGEAKMNTATLFPHEIVAKYCPGLGWSGAVKEAEFNRDLEIAWDNLPNYLDTDMNILVVRDGSGSMTAKVPGSKSTTALHVSTALTLYFAERMKGFFKNQFITFSRNARFVDMTEWDDTLLEKLKMINKYDDCDNTNVEAVFDLVLNTAKMNDCKQSDLPDAILVVSDMQFDCMNNDRYWGGYYGYTEENGLSDRTLAGFETIKKKYEDAGLRVPRLIFWNVCSRDTRTIPLVENALGLSLVSGYSASIISMVLSGEIDPWKQLKKELDSDRYKPVADIITM